MGAVAPTVRVASIPGQNAKVKAANEAIGGDAWSSRTRPRRRGPRSTIEAGRRGDKPPRGDDARFS